jgi:2-keto-4-pentenoate hydratase/2-oxohepta-3-ene-1,7-dioic acid hydratase in catechol pathway
VRFARIHTNHGPQPVVHNDDRWREIADPFADEVSLTGPEHPVEFVRFLAPVHPTVVLGMAHNGSPAERARPPQAFMKSARTVINPGDDIVLDDHVGVVHIESELAVVIGRHCRNLTAADVPNVILGYTVGNDVTAVEQVPLDDKMTQAKNGDGFTPIGPWIDTDIDPSHLRMTVHVNGEHIISSNTDQLAYTVTEQLVFLTSYVTLGPGDIVLTGSPGTSAPVKPGDISTVFIDGIGILSNPVR